MRCVKLSYKKSLLDGDEHSQILSLHDYRLEILRTHPGSTVKFKCTGGTFEGMYVCLSPLKVGFPAGCRPIISFRKNFKGKTLKDQMWRCARASYIPAFNRELDTLNMISSDACEYLKKIDPHHWSRSHFKSQFKCDMLLNNLCECFNSIILEARTKGIITLNEAIRRMLMTRIQKRRDVMSKCETMHCPKIIKKL